MARVAAVDSPRERWSTWAGEAADPWTTAPPQGLCRTTAVAAAATLGSCHAAALRSSLARAVARNPTSLLPRLQQESYNCSAWTWMVEDPGVGHNCWRQANLGH